MANVFSRRTLEQFEAASASIPLRPLDRAFEAAQIRPGEDPGGPAGARRRQFRRYVASVDQRDPQQRDRLGDVLGALIEEVAASKQDFLVKAAERDGFRFADGAFRPAGTGARAFAVIRVEDFAFIDEHGRRLHLLAHDRPKDAVIGAQELVESVCRTVLLLCGESAPGETADLVDTVKSTLEALELVPSGLDNPNEGAALVGRYLEQISALIAGLGESRNVHDSVHAGDEKWAGLSPRRARLAVGAAVTFVGFVAETYVERAASKSG